MRLNTRIFLNTYIFLLEWRDPGGASWLERYSLLALNRPAAIDAMLAEKTAGNLYGRRLIRVQLVLAVGEIAVEASNAPAYKRAVA